MSGDHLAFNIDNFLDKCRPRMKALVEWTYQGLSLLPSWKLEPSADSNLARHVSELHIPILSNGRPSLLLHGLGEEKDHLDRARSARIPGIFTERHTCVT